MKYFLRAMIIFIVLLCILYLKFNVGSIKSYYDLDSSADVVINNIVDKTSRKVRFLKDDEMEKVFQSIINLKYYKILSNKKTKQYGIGHEDVNIIIKVNADERYYVFIKEDMVAVHHNNEMKVFRLINTNELYKLIEEIVKREI